MPVEIKDSDGGLGNILTTWGIVKEKELINRVKENLKIDKVKLKNYKYSLTDHTAVKEFKFSNQDIRQLTEICIAAAKVNPEIIVAIVAKKDLIFGLSRMWEELSYESSWETMVFRDRDEAEIWIKERVKEKYKIDDLTFS